MAQCNVQTLFSNAAGFAALPTGSQRQLARLSLLVQIIQAKNPAFVLNVQQLITDAGCFECLTPGMWKLIKVQLYCEILGGIA